MGLNMVQLMADVMTTMVLLRQHDIEITTLTIGKYQIVRRDGLQGVRWAIMDGSFCYNHIHKEFEWEPMPSSRTDEFITETRFESLVEAVLTAKELPTK